MLKTESSSCFKFDQDLSQEPSMSGHLDEITPRHDSIYFVETSGKSFFYQNILKNNYCVSHYIQS